MPTISLPKFELPQAFRDMTADDVAKAMPEVHLPKVDVEAFGKRAGKVIDDVAKNAGKAVDDVAKNAGKAVDDVARSVTTNVEQALPRRSGPSPVPFAILAMVGGLVVGWMLATSPTTAPRINSFMDWLRGRIDDWRAGRMTDLEDDLEDTADEVRSATEGLGQPVMAEPEYAGTSAATMHTSSYADDQPWSDQPEDMRARSLGAASADDPFRQPAPGTGQMTDQLQIDDTEGDDANEADPPYNDEPLGGGRLTDTMRIDDTDDAEEVRPAPPDRF
jgi:hypothetical protein